MPDCIVFFRTRKKIVREAVAVTFVIMAVLLASGCLGNDYIRNGDVGVTKLTAAGVTEWSVLITTGRDTQAGDIIEYSDGSYILEGFIAEPENFARPVLRPIKISRDGKIEWDQPVNLSDCGSYVLILNGQGNVTQLFHNGTVCPPVSTGEYAENSSGNFSIRGRVKETNDGGLILSGIKKESYLMTKEEFVERHQTEYQETKEFAENEWSGWCENRILAENNPEGCKSHPMVSTIITKITPDNKISWQRDLPNYSSEAVSITEMKSGRRYIAGFGDSIVQVTPEGTVSNIFHISNISEYEPQPVSENNSDMTPVIIGSTVLRFDRDGRIISKESLPAGKRRTPTRDGGLLMVDVKYMQLSNGKEDPLCFAIKYNIDGSTNWTGTVQTPFELPDPTRVIQTSDGGYVVVSWADNQTGRKV